MKSRHVIIGVAVLAIAGLTACSSGTQGVAAVSTPIPTVTVTSTPTPSPSTVTVTPPPPPKTKVVTETVVPKVTIVQAPPVVVQPAPVQQWNGNPGYYGPSAGTYSLTRFAYPGPIHSYSSPRDTSSFVETIPATSTVTVYCSVVGQNIQAHPYWDWDGAGWIWDYMVEIGGFTPPSC